MASEENFIRSELSNKDLEALCILEDPQKALEKLLGLSKNENVTEKIQYINHLAEIISNAEEEGIASLEDILSSIKDDSAIEVKKAMMKQINPIARILSNHDVAKITSLLLPILSNLVINSHNYEVKEIAWNEFLGFGPFFSKDEQEKLFLPVIKKLVEDDDNEENRVVGIKLFSSLAFDFGEELTEKFFIKTVLVLEKDTASIKKEIIENIPSLAKKLSQKVLKDKIIPLYLKFSKDKNWGVRKSCAEIIYELSNLCEGELKRFREKELADIMNIFLKDSQKAIKISAYKNLGLYISTLKDLNIHQNLFESYLSMTSENIKSLTTDNEILYSCSYSFSAVLSVVGASKWPQLSETFKALLLGDDEVQKPLAYSLHEIAKIIGKQEAEHDLLFILECYLKGQNAEIKYGALKNLHSFLEVFPLNQRDKMVNLYQQLIDNQRNWRVLELIGGKMDKLVSIFSTKVIFEILVPMSFDLCQHNIFSVRKKAAKNIYHLLNAFEDSSEDQKIIIDKILDFAKSKKFSERQMYVVMVGKIMVNQPEIFFKYFYEEFDSLINDKMPAVRISIAQTLQKMKIPERPEIQQEIEKFKNDSSYTVRFIIHSILSK